MKKRSLVVLSASLLLMLGVAMLAGCGGGGSAPAPSAPAPAEPTLSGKYYLVSATFDDELVSEEDFFFFAFDEWYMDFQSSGDLEAYMMDEIGEGSYKINGDAITLTIEGDDAEARLDGDRIILDMEDGIFIYEKERRLPVPVTLSAQTLSGRYYLIAAEFEGENVEEEDFFAFELDRWHIYFMDESNIEVYMMSEFADGTYWIDGTTISLAIEDDEVIEAQLDGDRIILAMEDETFIYGKEQRQPAAPADSGADRSSGNENLADAIAWWSGDWYGSWYVFSASEAYDHLVGEPWDVYVHIKLGPNGKGTAYVWDDDIELGTVEIEIDISDGSPGVATSTGGEFFDTPIKAYNNYWWIDTSDGGHYDDNLIIIDEEFVDEDMDRIDYIFRLRPWGMRWDHEFDTLPPYYDWYLGVCDEPMLEVLGELGVLHSALQ